MTTELSASPAHGIGLQHSTQKVPRPTLPTVQGRSIMDVRRPADESERSPPRSRRVHLRSDLYGASRQKQESKRAGSLVGWLPLLVSAMSMVGAPSLQLGPTCTGGMLEVDASAQAGRGATHRRISSVRHKETSNWRAQHLQACHMHKSMSGDPYSGQRRNPLHASYGVTHT